MQQFIATGEKKRARANKNEVYPDGDAQSFCCEPTCQAYTCDIMKGLTLDIAPWFQFVCVVTWRSVALYNLLEGYCSYNVFLLAAHLAEAKAHLTRVSDETCCTATCSSVVCPTGYKNLGWNCALSAREVVQLGNTEGTRILVGWVGHL